MQPPLYECLSYETFIGLSAYATMGVFFFTSTVVLDWNEIKRDIPGFGKVFGEKGVISEEVALVFFYATLVVTWVGAALIADLFFW